MPTDARFVATVVRLLALGVVFGIIWGRLSEKLAIPELLRMLATPLLTGALALVFGFPLSLVLFGARIRNSHHHGAVAATAVSCFAAGILLGVPAIFGWALGYRKNQTARPLASRRPPQ